MKSRARRKLRACWYLLIYSPETDAPACICILEVIQRCNERGVKAIVKLAVLRTSRVRRAARSSKSGHTSVRVHAYYLIDTMTSTEVSRLGARASAFNPCYKHENSSHWGWERTTASVHGLISGLVSGARRAEDVSVSKFPRLLALSLPGSGLFVKGSLGWRGRIRTLGMLQFYA